VTKYHEAGKGGDRRQEEVVGSYGTGYDRIWGKKVRRETADEINQQLQDALAEDEEFERIAREQGEKK